MQTIGDQLRSQQAAIAASHRKLIAAFPFWLQPLVALACKRQVSNITRRLKRIVVGYEAVS